MRRPLLLLLGLVVALAPGAALAHAVDLEGGTLIRIDGDVTVPNGEDLETVVVVEGDVLIQGRAETVIVIDGTVRLDSAIVNNVIAVSGAVEIGQGTLVGKDVVLVDSSLTQEEGSFVEGDVREGIDASIPVATFFAFSALLYIGMTILVLLAGLLAAAVAPRQVRAAGSAITESTGWTLLAAALAFIVAPIAAVLVLFTILGIPTGVALLVVGLPALWFVGYLVSGIRLGEAFLSSRGSEDADDAEAPAQPLVAAVLGLGVLQLVGVVPVVGVLVIALVGLLGGGAVALVGWRAIRGRPAGTPIEAQAEAP